MASQPSKLTTPVFGRAWSARTEPTVKLGLDSILLRGDEMKTGDTRVEAVARAIYMTHWGLAEESKYGVDRHDPHTWDGASQAVRFWVLKQAAAAVAAYEAWNRQGT